MDELRTEELREKGTRITNAKRTTSRNTYTLISEGPKKCIELIELNLSFNAVKHLN